jgi:hypothetical protein
VTLTHQPNRIVVNEGWDLASEQGDWRERWTEKGGVTELRGIYLTMWKRNGGSGVLTANEVRCSPRSTGKSGWFGDRWVARAPSVQPKRSRFRPAEMCSTVVANRAVEQIYRAWRWNRELPLPNTTPSGPPPSRSMLRSSAATRTCAPIRLDFSSRPSGALPQFARQDRGRFPGCIPEERFIVPFTCLARLQS